MVRGSTNHVHALYIDGGSRRGMQNREQEMLFSYWCIFATFSHRPLPLHHQQESRKMITVGGILCIFFISPHPPPFHAAPSIHNLLKT